jgi:rhamnosyltransferase
MTPKNIAVVIVFYNPSEADIRQAEMLSSEYLGVIVDNSIKPCTNYSKIGLMNYICNHHNVGIAKAQNRAIRQICEDRDIKYIVFLDQDSRVALSYPKEIVKEFTICLSSYPSLALLGPTVIKKTDNDAYSSVFHSYSNDINGFSKRTAVISSGCCISREALDKVGLFDNNMFIDYVDYEWCWRAQSVGLICGITNKLIIKHKVGVRELSIGKYKVIVSAPFRYYYQYRNYIWLTKKGYVPLQWKLAYGCKLAARFLYFPLFVDGGKECWRHMKRGICSGFRQLPNDALNK